MEYDLTRIDYTITGITFPDTLKVLPVSGPKSQQKFVIGDKNGVLQCLGIKDEEPIVQFKTLPGKPITSVQLASVSGSQTDKIFAASGNEVKGYTRKGKVFLTIETSVSETITSMYVQTMELRAVEKKKSKLFTRSTLLVLRKSKLYANDGRYYTENSKQHTQGLLFYPLKKIFT
ncbi:unnamed protein product [Diatraea saccharalis]|uniref:BBS7 beta-propeller domain-containing protein n=1 Tax=Diatraea saccharalis TaxID=40085 RepID=A0A9N9WGG3_9NEOP|nr:unnamed protein product [Diatraea saccharalis]